MSLLTQAFLGMIFRYLVLLESWHDWKTMRIECADLQDTNHSGCARIRNQFIVITG